MLATKGFRNPCSDLVRYRLTADARAALENKLMTQNLTFQWKSPQFRRMHREARLDGFAEGLERGREEGISRANSVGHVAAGPCSLTP